MFGLIETCLAFKKSGASSISGLILINSTPFSKHFEIPFSVICLPTPPAETEQETPAADADSDGSEEKEK